MKAKEHENVCAVRLTWCVSHAPAWLTFVNLSRRLCLLMSAWALCARQGIEICCSFGIFSKVACSCLGNKLAARLSSLSLHIRPLVYNFLLFSYLLHFCITTAPPFRFRIYEISLKSVHSKVCVGGVVEPTWWERPFSTTDSRSPVYTNPIAELQIPVAVPFETLAHPVIDSGCDS